MIKREDFGKRFAIHASREIDDTVYERIAEIAPELVTIARNVGGGRDRFIREDWFGLSQLTSAVIAVATLDRCIAPIGCIAGEQQYADRELAQLSDQRRWFFGPVGYVLRDVITLPSSVPCRGFQGLWTLPDDVRARVEEQLR